MTADEQRGIWAEEGRKSRARGGANKFKKRPWTQAEIILILTSPLDDLKLAAILRRSVTAIQVKRSAEGGFKGEWDLRGKANRRQRGAKIEEVLNG